MVKNNLNIVYLGLSGFPYGLAELQRMLLISKALVIEKANVKVIGRRGIHNREQYPDLKKVGHYQGIIYMNSSGTPFRRSGFLIRNLNKIFEGFFEFRLLCKLNKREKIDAAIISSMNFRHLFFYRIVSRLLRFKVILNFVEYNSAISGRGNLKFRINDYLFDRHALSCSDGVLVISEFLIEIIKKDNEKKPYLKIPVLVDMERFKGVFQSGEEKYFLFCGSADYLEVIFFIIKSFEYVKNKNAFLYLVTNGAKEKLAEIQNFISLSEKSDLIKVYSHVTDIKLSELYKNASALLIPLRPTIQDVARFPHKFGEYTASGNPVITTNYGEVKYYFQDMKNALVANEYDEKAFAAKMEFVMSNPSESRLIGENGKKFASEHADYKIYGERIINFINSIQL